MESKDFPGRDYASGLARQGKIQEALDYYDKSLALNPTNVALLYSKAIALISLGRYEEALVYSRKAVSINPYDADLWINLGVVHHKLDLRPQATEALEQAVELSPYNAYARALLGIIYQEMEMDDKAQVQNRKLQEIVFPREYAGFYFATAAFLLGILLGGVISVEGKLPELTFSSGVIIVFLFWVICSLYIRSLRLFRELNRDVLTIPYRSNNPTDRSRFGIYLALGLMVVVFVIGIFAGMSIWAHFH